MRSTPKADRDARRKTYEERGLKKITLAYNGWKFDCFIIPAAEVPPDLQMGIMQFTPDMAEWQELGKDEKEAFFVLSDAVPAPHDRLWVYHEVYEFTMGDTCGVKGFDCQRASAAELAIALETLPTETAHRHFALRRQFFRDLIAFGKKNDFPRPDVLSFEQSLYFWEGACERFAVPDAA